MNPFFYIVLLRQPHRVWAAHFWFLNMFLGRFRQFSLVLLLLLAGGVVLCAHPLAGISLGGASHTYGKPALAAKLSGIHDTWIRLEGFPGDYQRDNPNSLRFVDVVDTIALANEIRAMKARGNRIMVNVFYMPKVLSSCPNGDDPRMCAPRDYQAWRQLLQDAVQWLNRSPGLRIEYWEIANEPSGGHFFRQWNTGGFWTWFFETAQALRSADPTLKIGGIGDNPMFLEHYDNLLSQSVQRNVPLDFITVHWHGFWDGDAVGNPWVFPEFGRRLVLLSEKRTGRALPIFWTEWSHSVDVPAQDIARVSAYMVQSIYAMSLVPEIQGAMFFRAEPYAVRASLTETYLDVGHRVQSPGRVLAFLNSMEGNSVLFSRPAPRGTTWMATATDTTFYVIFATIDADVKDYIASFFAYSRWKKVERKYWIEDSVAASRSGEFPAIWTDTLDVDAFNGQKLLLPRTGVWMGSYRRLQ